MAIRKYTIPMIVWLALGVVFFQGKAEAGSSRIVTLQQPSVSRISTKLEYGYVIVTEYKIALQRLELAGSDGTWTTVADRGITVDVTDGAAGSQLNQWTIEQELAIGTYRSFRLTMNAEISYKAAVQEKGSARWWVTGYIGGGSGDLLSASKSSVMNSVKWVVKTADLADSPSSASRSVIGNQLVYAGTLPVPLVVGSGQAVTTHVSLELDKALVGRMTPWNNPGLVPVPQVRIR